MPCVELDEAHMIGKKLRRPTIPARPIIRLMLPSGLRGRSVFGTCASVDPCGTQGSDPVPASDNLAHWNMAGVGVPSSADLVG
jgi:hypothetical protein